MARIRSVKPELATSEVVAKWPREVRYAFVLLWTYLDDRGRGLDSPKAIAGALFAHDDDITPRKMANWLTKMATSERPSTESPLCRYEVHGRKYLHCINWDEHQKPNRPSPSRLPPCPTHEHDDETLTEPDSEGSLTDSLHGAAVLGAEELGARSSSGRAVSAADRAAAGAGIIEHHTDATPAEAAALAEWIQQQRRPRNLAGLINALARGPDLKQMLEEMRTRNGKRGIGAAIDAARKGPPCKHGEAGGAFLHPTTQLPLCPLCRKESPADA